MASSNRNDTQVEASNTIRTVLFSKSGTSGTTSNTNPSFNTFLPTISTTVRHTDSPPTSQPFQLLFPSNTTVPMGQTVPHVTDFVAYMNQMQQKTTDLQVLVKEQPKTLSTQQAFLDQRNEQP